MLVELRKRSQITIPSDIVKRLGIKEGDKFEVRERRRYFSLPGSCLSKIRGDSYCQTN